MSESYEKQFAVSMVVSCKRSSCELQTSDCAACIESFIGDNVKKHSRFGLTQATTSNNSKQFVVSFVAHCHRPDCGSATVETGSCCTASADKCEMCLRTIVSRSIRSLYGFHAKEIVVA